MNTIEAWDNEDAKLVAEMNDFESNWKHRKPCKDYIQNGYCMHLEQAQSRKFKGRVRSHMTILSSYFSRPQNLNKAYSLK